MFSSIKLRLAALLTFVVAIAAYWPTLGADFVLWDDDLYVFNNPKVLA